MQVEFFGQQLGLFHAIANAELQHQETCALDISATVVEQTVCVCVCVVTSQELSSLLLSVQMILTYKDSGLEIKELEFGAVFYGRPKVLCP